jgi:coatomer protein complex subunit alpha (xenin)
MQAQKVLQKSEQMARNEHSIDYDERTAFSVDPVKLTPIYKGQPSIRCSFCSSIYSPEFKDTLCVTCGVSLVRWLLWIVVARFVSSHISYII